METYDKFEEAKANCPADYVVSGTVFADGTPIYFTVPADCHVDVVRDKAFEIREDRLLTEAERNLINLARLVTRAS